MAVTQQHRAVVIHLSCLEVRALHGQHSQRFRAGHRQESCFMLRLQKSAWTAALTRSDIAGSQATSLRRPRPSNTKIQSANLKSVPKVPPLFSSLYTRAADKPKQDFMWPVCSETPWFRNTMCSSVTLLSPVDGRNTALSRQLQMHQQCPAKITKNREK